MRCSGCGKDIPFGGEVCPYCQREKAGDQATTIAVAIGMIVGGVVGYMIGEFIGMLIGGFVCGVAFAIPAAGSAQKKAKLAPRVRLDNPAPVQRPAQSIVQQAPSNSIEARLERLHDLRAKDLITAEEYLARRQEIIQSI